MWGEPLTEDLSGWWSKGAHYTFILPEFYPQDEDKNKKLKIGNIQRWILWKQIIYKDMTKSSIYSKKPMHRFPAFPGESSHRNPHGSIPGLSNTPSLFIHGWLTTLMGWPSPVHGRQAPGAGDRHCHNFLMGSKAEACKGQTGCQ